MAMSGAAETTSPELHGATLREACGQCLYAWSMGYCPVFEVTSLQVTLKGT